jgi:hypothetical protein
MATRKKKESMTMAMPGTIGSAEIVLPKEKKSKEKWPKIVVGSHLTVTTHEDGRTELKWDDAALEREVREAISSVELANLKPAVRAKAATRQKKAKAKE